MKFLAVTMITAILSSPVSARPHGNEPGSQSAGRDAGQGAVRFWDRVDHESCFGLSRAYYAEYLATLGLNYGDSWTVGTGEAHELNQTWTDMWCRSKPE
ncbi:hypothetical protein ACWPM1_13360 [Tsuneonella sp. HG249]